MPDWTRNVDTIVRAYFNRRMAVLLALGFASGVPLALTGNTLQAWMKDRNVDLSTIGLFGLLSFPYLLKFLWAPLMDRYVPPLLGRRRGWILVTQLLLIIAISLMAFAGNQSSLIPLAILSLAVAFFSASQDIAFDAYRVDLLPDAERGAGAAITVAGYRIAMIGTGAGAFLLVGSLGLSWSATYFLSAGAMLVGVVATILAPEATAIAAPPPTLADAVIKPLLQFLARPSGWLVLAFVLMFKLPDEFAASMSIPFMRDLEISLVDIGMIRQGLGIFITILGAFVGGGIVARLGIMRSLWIFGVLQAVSNLGYLALAHFGPDYAVLVAVICVENFCSGLVTAGFVAFLMSQCDPRFSATQFALLSSLMAVTRILSPAPAGLVAELVSWPVFFILTIALSAPAMVMLLWIRPRPQSQSEDEPRGFDVILPPAPMENATPVR